MCIFTIALLYFVIYPTITVNAVRILAECHSICTDVGFTNCTSYMRSDYSISCDTATHGGYVAFAAIVFAIVGIGTPALLGQTLWKHRENFLKQYVSRNSLNGRTPFPSALQKMWRKFIFTCSPGTGTSSSST